MPEKVHFGFAEPADDGFPHYIMSVSIKLISSHRPHRLPRLLIMIQLRSSVTLYSPLLALDPISVPWQQPSQPRSPASTYSLIHGASIDHLHDTIALGGATPVIYFSSSSPPPTTLGYTPPPTVGAATRTSRSRLLLCVVLPFTGQ